MKYILLLISVSACLFLPSCSKSGDKTPKPAEQTLYQTDFDKDDGYWGTSAAKAVHDGAYWLEGSAASARYVAIQSLFPSDSRTTAIETSVKPEYLNNNTDQGLGGLIINFKIDNTDYSFIAFSISYDGYFDIAKTKPGGGYTKYINWTENAAIRKNAFNQLRVVRSPDKIRFYINQTEVYSLVTTAELVLDQTGLIAFNDSRISADYFKAVQLE